MYKVLKVLFLFLDEVYPTDVGQQRRSQVSKMKASAQKSCDFETEDLCGWSHDSNHDFDWRRHNFATPSGHVGTGPSCDHSLGPGLNGHYMYLETSSPRLQNDTARLFSPVFAAPASPACFSFWYHMYGLTTGVLNVYLHSKDSTLLFTLSGNQGDDWRQAIVPLPLTNSSFQIVIEGVRGAGYEGDTAVDDVQLTEGDECIGLTTESVEETSEESSCVGRCFLLSAEPAWCECTADCISNNTCCLDFPQECATTTSSPIQATTSNMLVSENTFTTAASIKLPPNTLFETRSTPTAIPSFVLTTTEATEQSRSSHKFLSNSNTSVNSTGRVTTLPVGFNTSITTKTSTTTIAITKSNTSPQLLSTSVTHSPKAQFTNRNKTDSSQSFPLLSTSSSTFAPKLSSTTTATTLPTLLSTTSNIYYAKAEPPTISPISNKLDGRKVFAKLSTSSPIFAAKMSSVTTTVTSPKLPSTVLNPYRTKPQFPTFSTFGNKANSTPYIPKPFTPFLTSTSKQSVNPTKASIFKVTEATAVQMVTTKVNANLTSVRLDLNSSTKNVFYFITKHSTTKAIPYQSKPVFFSLTSTPRTSQVASLPGKDAPKVQFQVPPPVVRFRFPNKSTTLAAKLGPRYPKTRKNTMIGLSSTTMNPKTMRNSTVKVPKSKNDVLHPVWKDFFPLPPPLPPLEPKPEVVVHGLETTPPTRPTTSTSQETTVSMTSPVVKGWKWKSKYRQRVEAPVHAPVQAMPASPSNGHIIALVCCGLAVIIAVLVTVCVVRKRKINRGYNEDDELDIRFLPPDEILDFTLARPSMEETRLCEGPS